MSLNHDKLMIHYLSIVVAELLYSKYGVIGYVSIEYIGHWDAYDEIPKLSALVSTYVH